ncbi:MAG: transcriptional regulator [Terracidiphilus sp.]|jgi:photosystem II stability/assembly factor-like uncharacterized protein
MSRLQICLDFPYWRGGLAPGVLALLFAIAGQRLPAQSLWSAVGPAGGDARVFAAVPGQPHHLYLGSTNSWIFESVDEGASWHRLAKLDPSEDLVVDSILVDSANPAVVYASGWKVDQRDGGMWVSRDGGRHWDAMEGLRGQSVFSLAQAPSDAKILYAGTWEGVYRSTDAGTTWKSISPPGSQEIHEVESLAVDPADPNIVYAGTWHLPWKTDDGGNSWKSIKDGLIDDSDVFSIIIDPQSPQTVFLSACSGIYKSENAGELFQKIQGIPKTAQRTRVLMQDPAHREVVYAGTTEGLYKTVDGGKTFQRMTGPDVIVNGLYVDPQDSNRVLLATDRGGVLASKDGGTSFDLSNEGFSGRKVEALLVPPAVGPTAPAARIFAGVVNDKSYGGVFVSSDGGAHWEQISEGLEGRDVFALAQAQDGTVLAGTSHGIFALEAGTADAPGARWSPRNTIQNTLVKTATETHYGKRVNVEKRVKATVYELDSRVNAFDLSGDVWVASTGIGLLTSIDQGASWQGGPVMGSGEYLSVTAHGATMAAARADGVVLSTDAGSTWTPMGIPTMLTRIHRVAFSADGTLWLGAREGVYFTRDLGKTWLWMERLPFRDVDDLTYEAALGKVLASSRSNDQVYAIDPKTLDWTWWQTGYRIGLIRAAGKRLVAASLYDGVLVEPQAAEVETGPR